MIDFDNQKGDFNQKNVQLLVHKGVFGAPEWLILVHTISILIHKMSNLIHISIENLLNKHQFKYLTPSKFNESYFSSTIT